MFRYLSIIIAISLLPLIGAGCITKQDSIHTYTVDIERSSIQKDARNAALETPNTNMKHLLSEVGIKTETAPREEYSTVTKLDGVISTLNKEWHLYINNIYQSFTYLEHVPVSASDIIEWKYEEPTNE
ncbi:hypothetical protein HN682_02240 [Candidatus Peregrinibacteria bacterium]|jgi:hypothetical protein|nr:hypothetical protein [Candidatus Peregrinibacteria bacterium]